MHLIKAKILIAAILTWSMLPSRVCADTRTGTGGETMQLYISQVYVKVLLTIQRLQEKPTAPGVLASYCRKANDVQSNEKAAYCEEFIWSTLDSIQELMTKDPAIELLSWKDKECKKIQVGSGEIDWPLEAKTLLGPEGPICFNHKKITGISPDRLFTLIFHELGHKVSFEGAYIKDSEELGPFRGFQLLTAAGYALSQWALDQQIIRPKFLLVDTFTCNISEEDSSQTIQVNTFGIRSFKEPGNYDVYEAGTRISANSISANSAIKIGDVFFAFQLIIHEEAGCSNKASIDQRFLKIDIMEVYGERTGQTNEVKFIQQGKAQNRNPLCESNNRTPFHESYGKIRISCLYTGSQVH